MSSRSRSRNRRASRRSISRDERTSTKSRAGERQALEGDGKHQRSELQPGWAGASLLLHRLCPRGEAWQGLEAGNRDVLLSKKFKPWRQGDVFKDDLDSDEEEVVYQQISKVMDKRMVHKGVQMRELRQNDMVHNLALAVVDKDANLLSPAQNQEENIDNKEILEKKKLSSSKN